MTSPTYYKSLGQFKVNLSRAEKLWQSRMDLIKAIKADDPSLSLRECISLIEEAEVTKSAMGYRL